MRSESQSKRDKSESTDFDFRHHLYDTILLLGGKKEIAELLKKSQDGMVEEADIDALRKYNISLFTDAKTRLNNLNALRIASAEE